MSKRKRLTKKVKPDWTSDDGTVQLYCGDCLDILPTFEDGSVDAVVTDPPYNVGYKYEGDSSKDKKDNYEEWCSLWFSEWFSDVRRCCAGVVTISCGQPNLALWGRIEPSAWTLCWWKPAAMGRSPVVFCNWEPMPLWGESLGGQGVDVIRAGIVPDSRLSGHPCPKPLGLAVGCLSLLTCPGHLALDPFTGSGTTGVACVRLGRRFIGIEKEPKYFDIAVERIKEEMQKPKLIKPNVTKKKSKSSLFGEEGGYFQW